MIDVCFNSTVLQQSRTHMTAHDNLVEQFKKKLYFLHFVFFLIYEQKSIFFPHIEVSIQTCQTLKSVL